MKHEFPDELENSRTRIPGLPPTRRGDRCGVFIVGHLRIIASDGRHWGELFPLPAWEHVSVSRADRAPSWAEMCYVKRLFWSDDETVLQFHPPKRLYVNHHPNCLHLWKPVGIEIPLPPAEAVGPLKGAPR